MSSFLRVSARCHDGLVIMESLARVWKNSEVLSLEQISEETVSPLGYLEQIAASLKKAGLVCSERGRGGGYKLGRGPERISVKEVIEAIEGPIVMVDCLGEKESCARTVACRTRGIWNRIQKDISGAMDNLSVADIIK